MYIPERQSGAILINKIYSVENYLSVNEINNKAACNLGYNSKVPWVKFRGSVPD